MTTENGTTIAGQDPSKVTEPVESKGKGKGKAVEDPTDASMDENEDDDSDEEAGEDDDNEEEEGMEEIDLGNIVAGGRRTRGRVIDWAKAAEENPAEDDDDDEDDFEPEKEEEDDKMDES